MFDFEAFEERAAILEYCAGMSRFAAETRAARAQGRERHEVVHAARKRNSDALRDQREASARDAANGVSGVQPAPEKKERPMPVGDIQAGRDRVELLALPVGRG